MSASPEVLAAFEAWKFAELASHYATPCPDDVMDALTSREADSFEALQAIAPTCGEDMLLKLFPLLLRDFQPNAGEPPLQPSKSSTYSYEPDFIDRLATQLRASHPALAAAIDAPHREHQA